MIDPSATTLRRRSNELQIAGHRQLETDPDSGALLLFYAAECALKALYMQRNNLKNTDDARGGVSSARSYVHYLLRLIGALNIPRASVKVPPPIILSRSGISINISDTHQAWRYGEKINDTSVICEWLNSIIEWCRGK